MLDLEKQYYSEKVNYIAGTDEAGRGCLLGPVVAAAVVFKPDFFDERINDSKKLSEKADEIYTELSKEFMCDYDEAGSIGKRYRRQDEIGTPFCITYDFESEEDKCVTVRDRDTMEQVRIPIADLVSYITEKVRF